MTRDEFEDVGKLLNGHGEEIRHPDAYFRAVFEDKYGFQEEAQKRDSDIAEAINAHENRVIADEEARSKGFDSYSKMIAWVNDAEDLNEQYDRADSIGAPEPPYASTSDWDSGGDDW
jgi:hypothetical protein